jgi:hypothetical protein
MVRSWITDSHQKGNVVIKRFGVTLTSLLVAATICAACSSTTGTHQHASKPGVLIGTAYPCVGLPALSQAAYNKLQVHVTVSQGSKTVAHKSGHGSLSYMFAVSPGKYLLSGQRNTPSQVVTVRSSETVRTNLITECE